MAQAPVTGKWYDKLWVRVNQYRGLLTLMVGVGALLFGALKPSGFWLYAGFATAILGFTVWVRQCLDGALSEARRVIADAEGRFAGVAKGTEERLLAASAQFLAPVGYEARVNGLVAPLVARCRDIHREYPPCEDWEFKLTVGPARSKPAALPPTWQWLDFEVHEHWQMELLSDRDCSAVDCLPTLVVGTDALVNADWSDRFVRRGVAPYLPWPHHFFLDCSAEVKNGVRGIKYLTHVPWVDPGQLHVGEGELLIQLNKGGDILHVKLHPLLTGGSASAEWLRSVFPELCAADPWVMDQITEAVFAVYRVDPAKRLSPGRWDCELRYFYTLPMLAFSEKPGHRFDRQSYLVPFSSLATVKKITFDFPKTLGYTIDQAILAVPKRPQRQQDIKALVWEWSRPVTVFPGHGVVLRWYRTQIQAPQSCAEPLPAPMRDADTTNARPSGYAGLEAIKSE